MKDTIFYYKNCLRHWFFAKGRHALQSPFIFDFYEEVIVDKKHYYFFDEVENWISESPPEVAAKYLQNKRFYKFLFRFLLYFKVPSVNLYAESWDILFLSHANSKSQINVWQANSLQNKIQMHLFDCRPNVYFYPKKTTEFQNSLCVFSELPTEIINMKDLANGKFFILKGIYKKPMRAFWKELCSQKKATLCLDFFYWGVLFFERPQAKQYFILKS